MTSPRSRLDEALHVAIANFTNELVVIIRQATIEELSELDLRAVPGVPEEPGEPILVPAQPSEPSGDAERVEGTIEAACVAPTAHEETVSAAVASDAVRPEPAGKRKKRRSWPTCSVEGCTAKMYGPSGPARLCYQHHLQAGGEPSPFARKRTTGDSTAEGSGEDTQDERRRKVILRRKGEEPDPSASSHPGRLPAPAENPPLSAKDEGLRRVEAQLARKGS